MAREAIATPERILDAAFARFAQYGFRRTSMEDIASAAGVSRAALYLQFRNKEEIFRRLAQRLQEQSLEAAARAAATEAPLAERLRATTEAKTLTFVRLGFDSPHGTELLDEHNRLCGDVVAGARRRFVELLARAFRGAARRGEIDLEAAALSAPRAAELFHKSIQGLKGPGVTLDEYRAALASLVAIFVAGLTPRPGASAARRRAKPA